MADVVVLTIMLVIFIGVPLTGLVWTFRALLRCAWAEAAVAYTAAIISLSMLSSAAAWQPSGGPRQYHDPEAPIVWGMNAECRCQRLTVPPYAMVCWCCAVRP